MRVNASEKLELTRLVEGSSLSVRRTLVEVGLPRSILYAWNERYLEGRPGPRARSSAGRPWGSTRGSGGGSGVDGW